jgi:fatty-acyl-CoA synthase
MWGDDGAECPYMNGLAALMHAAAEAEGMTEAEMKEYINANMARYKVLRYIDFVDGFPMNAAGKILKYKMREDAVKKFNLQDAASIETA